MWLYKYNMSTQALNNEFNFKDVYVTKLSGENVNIVI